MNFYRRFIPEFSHVASPLHHLTKKAEPWRWTKPEEVSAPILILPDQGAHFHLETDASRYAAAAILSQLCDDEKWHPVGFMSKSLSLVERN